VSFRYAPDRPDVLHDFSLRIAPGECVVLMGPSGAGKSTLARLLQGFVWPTSGQVLVDGCDTRHLSANELRAHFGVVPQETMLFSGTILDNLLLANPLATFEMAVQAAKLAEIHTTIEAMPSGYKTDVGERGVGLSGGQKQRIAIARALLKRPRVLIFDEATSGLDHAVAEQFAATIARLKGKVTIVFVTHRAPERLQPDRVIHLAPLAERRAAA
jgi:subfamily B ATP-binding cassette protein HlyB/CyaB